jgi:hypothetical protein
LKLPPPNGSPIPRSLRRSVTLRKTWKALLKGAADALAREEAFLGLRGGLIRAVLDRELAALRHGRAAGQARVRLEVERIDDRGPCVAVLVLVPTRSFSSMSNRTRRVTESRLPNNELKIV